MNYSLKGMNEKVSCFIGFKIKKIDVTFNCDLIHFLAIKNISRSTYYLLHELFNFSVLKEGILAWR